MKRREGKDAEKNHDTYKYNKHTLQRVYTNINEGDEEPVASNTHTHTHTHTFVYGCDDVCKSQP